MRIGSLFSGIGGLELGLERAGVGSVAWQCEIDPFCRSVLAKHWPDAERYTDVRLLDPTFLPPVDVLCGGFPCQDLSLAGKRAGLDGDRSGLWWEYARVIEATRPRGVVIENVRGFLGRALDTVAGWLYGQGYQVEVTRIQAADVGAPHLRERVLVVAYAIGQGQPQQGGAIGTLWGRTVHGGREVVADTGSVRLEESEPGPVGEQPTASGGVQRCNRSAQPGMGVGAHGLPIGLAGPGPDGSWPAGRGAEPWSWESPRTLAGVKQRQQKLKALGNAVVPQCGYVAGRRLLELIGCQSSASSLAG
jgi:DNA (cytosine-5)-methyltransferase 1